MQSTHIYGKLLLATLLFVSVSVEAAAQRNGCMKYKDIQGKSDPDMPKYWMGIGLIGMDFNKDGHTDLIASANGPNTAFVYYGGRELFDTTADYTLRGGGEMVKGDFNGDGLTDLAIRGPFFHDELRDVIRYDTFYVYMGVSDSLYAIETTPRHIIPAPRSSHVLSSSHFNILGGFLFAADLDCDGKDELIMASDQYKDRLRANCNGGIFVWHYPRGDESDTLSYLYMSDNFSASLRSMSVVDVNGDGCADFVASLTEYKHPGGPGTWVPTRTRVAFGGPGRYPDLSRADQIFDKDDLSIHGGPPGSSVDYRRTQMLDVNRDGMADMLWYPFRDSLWIMYGTPQGLSGKVDQIIKNPDTRRWYGFGSSYFHQIGDYNADGHNDYILNLNAYGYAAMVVFGGNTYGLTDQAIAVCVVGDMLSGRYYVSMGDITGDGGDELATSDPIPSVAGIDHNPWRREPGFVGIIESVTYPRTGIDAELDPPVAPFSVEVYPSPSSGDITLLLKDEAPGEYLLKMYALDGKVILTRNYQLVNSGNVIVLQAGDYASDFSPGVHFIELRSTAGSVTRKVVLVKK